MKIIKEGVLPETKIWKGECNNCHTEFEAIEGEMTHIQHDQREGSWSWEKCLKCGAVNNSGVCFRPID